MPNPSYDLLLKYTNIIVVYRDEIDKLLVPPVTTSDINMVLMSTKNSILPIMIEMANDDEMYVENLVLHFAPLFRITEPRGVSDLGVNSSPAYIQTLPPSCLPLHNNEKEAIEYMKQASYNNVLFPLGKIMSRINFVLETNTTSQIEIIVNEFTYLLDWANANCPVNPTGQRKNLISRIQQLQQTFQHLREDIEYQTFYRDFPDTHLHLNMLESQILIMKDENFHRGTSARQIKREAMENTVHVVFHYEDEVVEELRTRMFKQHETAVQYMQSENQQLHNNMTEYLQTCKQKCIQPDWKTRGPEKHKSSRLWFPDGNESYVSLGHYVTEEWSNRFITWWNQWDGISPIEHSWIKEIGTKILWGQDTFCDIHSLSLK